MDNDESSAWDSYMTWEEFQADYGEAHTEINLMHKELERAKARIAELEALLEETKGE